MELREVISRRRMTRVFADQPLDDELIARLLSVVASAPSAGFSQGVELLALRREERRQRFWELASEREWRTSSPEAAGLLAAPLIVLPIADPTAYETRYAAPDKAESLLAGRPAEAWPVPYWLVDAAFCSMLVLLAAEDADLGALFFQLHGDATDVLRGLGVPDGRATIGALAIGRRVGGPGHPSTARRRARTLVHVDDYA